MPSPTQLSGWPWMGGLGKCVAAPRNVQSPPALYNVFHASPVATKTDRQPTLLTRDSTEGLLYADSVLGAGNKSYLGLTGYLHPGPVQLERSLGCWGLGALTSMEVKVHVKHFKKIISFIY